MQGAGLSSLGGSDGHPTGESGVISFLDEGTDKTHNGGGGRTRRGRAGRCPFAKAILDVEWGAIRARAAGNASKEYGVAGMRVLEVVLMNRLKIVNSPLLATYQASSGAK